MSGVAILGSHLLEPLPSGLVAALGDARAHPKDASAVRELRAIQTHISHVFLSGERVYKLHKAVRLPFVCFATRRERNADCARELQLNRRLAPDVYLGVAPIVARGTLGWQVGPLRSEADEAELAESRNEHCVVMRRLPSDRSALALLERGELGHEHMEAIARTMARFHDRVGLGVPAPYEPQAWLARARAPVDQNLALLQRLGLGPEARRALECSARMLAKIRRERREDFLKRRLEGRAVDAHGDLHLAHVYFEPGRTAPQVIDCLEFDSELRRIDTAAEVAFLAMDLAYRGRPACAEHFLAHYAACRDDYGLYAVVDYYIVHRALIRSGVATLAAREGEVPVPQHRRALESGEAHLRFAARWGTKAPCPGVVLLCGTVGSGKSRVAERVVSEVGGVVVSSDRTRKRLLGLPASVRASAAPGRGIYTCARRAAVYDALLERAEPIVRSGRTAVLDASFERAAWRRRAREWASVRRLPVLLLEVRCAPEIVRERLARRVGRAGEASDAGPEQLDASRLRFEPPLEWQGAHARICTDRGIDQRVLAAALRQWTGSFPAPAPAPAL